MIRIILIGVGVVTSTIAGYIAQRKLFRRRDEQLPLKMQTHRPSSRRTRKARCSSIDHALDNGEQDLDPIA